MYNGGGTNYINKFKGILKLKWEIKITILQDDNKSIDKINDMILLTPLIGLNKRSKLKRIQ
jgi:hypothetical protein